MKKLFLAFAAARAITIFIAGLCAISSGTSAADIGPCRSQSICLSGMIQQGDAAQFAAVAKNYPAGTYVWLDGPGGYMGDTLDIGDIIHRRGFSTVVSRDNGFCASACAVLFLSGYHAIIQRIYTSVFIKVSILMVARFQSTKSTLLPMA